MGASFALLQHLKLDSITIQTIDFYKPAAARDIAKLEVLFEKKTCLEFENRICANKSQITFACNSV